MWKWEQGGRKWGWVKSTELGMERHAGGGERADSERARLVV